MRVARNGSIGQLICVVRISPGKACLVGDAFSTLFCVLACKNLVVMSLQSYLAYRRTVTSDEHKSDQSGDCRDRADI